MEGYSVSLHPPKITQISLQTAMFEESLQSPKSLRSLFDKNQLAERFVVGLNLWFASKAAQAGHGYEKRYLLWEPGVSGWMPMCVFPSLTSTVYSSCIGKKRTSSGFFGDVFTGMMPLLPILD